MFDPNSINEAPANDINPRHYWALLLWCVVTSLVIGLTAYVIFGV